MSIKILFCGGMIRSGSTLQFQIAAHLLESHALGERCAYLEPEALDKRLRDEEPTTLIRVIKTHVPTPTVLGLLKEHRALALYSYRDIRDVALSAMRAFKIPWPEFRDNRWLETAIEAERLWTEAEGVLVQRYEDLVADLPAAIDQIAQHLGIGLQARETTELAKRFGLEAQRERLLAWEHSAPPEATYHPRELLRRGHLAPDAPGRWKDNLPVAVARELTARFHAWLEQHSYSLLVDGPDLTEIGGEVFVPHVGWLTYEEGDDVLTGLREGDYEYTEQATLVRVLRPGDVFIDCGAHCGLFSKLALGCLGGEGHVAAIEPDPKSFQRLERNTTDYGVHTISRHRLALGDSDGSVAFQQEGAGRAAFNHVCLDEGTATTRVAQETLSTFLGRLPAPEITVMKIDCEGSELAILRGAAPLLSRGNPKVVMIEFNSENLRRYGGTCAGLVEHLAQHGYKFFTLDPARCRLEPCNPTAAETYANYFATCDPSWLQERFANARDEARRKAADILQRGNHVTEFKRQLYATVDEQKDFISILQHERDRLSALVAKYSGDIAGLSSTAKTQADYISVLEKERDRLAARETQLTKEVAGLSSTAKTQADHISVLEKERDRLAARETQLTKEVAGLSSTAKTQADHISVLEKERDRLAARETQLTKEVAGLSSTAKTQADHISVLEKERDRLNARETQLTEETAHYLKVMDEQLRYIKILEAERSQAPSNKS
ncbi:MAG: FkbM family methyltransferase [Opitutaceae bacterium]